MRIITLHCDYIKFKPLKKALKEPEELSEERKKEIEVKEVLVVLTAVEKGDDSDTIKQLVESVKKTSGEVKAKKIVLYPYAHLSSNLSDPATAVEYLTKAHEILEKDGFSVVRAPFGYYKEFELKCKGHPLSELSKEFRKEGVSVEVKTFKKPMEEDKEEDIPRLLKEISRSKLDTSKLKENDHRILGQKLDLFSFNEASPGSTFWHPKGLVIFNELMKFSRDIQKENGYQEVSAPLVFDTKLWKVSGHWKNYRENMFLTEYEGRNFGIKPMNCPGHMLLYKTKSRSYKELPLRFSEYSPLHRMELSGVLAGLFRVIRLHQDDAHLFCAVDQIEDEISNILKLMNIIYKDTFGFEYSEVNLSTRPEKFMGEIKDWEKAEDSLEKVLKKNKIKYNIKKGDGAFYGPKIDFQIKDSLGRDWQCATIQLDMQLPKRFELTYMGSDNKEHTPIVIHRALFGSLERFIGVLLEHLNGALPLWLSPVQVRIIDFTERNTKSAQKIFEKIKKELPDLRIDSDFRNTTVNDKVRDAEMQKIPYLIVIGDKEEEKNTLAVRRRGEKKPEFGVKIDKFLQELKEKIQKRS